MLYLNHENPTPTPAKTEDERIIDAFNQAQAVGKARTIRLREEWTRLHGVVKNLEKDYARRVKVIPLLETDIEILSANFIAPLQRTVDELIKVKKQHQKSLSDIKGNSGVMSRMSPSWHREINLLQLSLDKTKAELIVQQANLKNMLSSSKQRAKEQAKTNEKLNLHRTKGILPLKWKIEDYKLVLEALEARCLAVSACVLAHNDEKAVVMASIWKRLSRGEPVSMGELGGYWDSEKEDLKPKSSVEEPERERLYRNPRVIENDIEQRMQEISMQHSQAMIASLSQLLLKMQTVTPAPEKDKVNIVDADFIEISIDDFPIRKD